MMSLSMSAPAPVKEPHAFACSDPILSRISFAATEVIGLLFPPGALLLSEDCNDAKLDENPAQPNSSQGKTHTLLGAISAHRAFMNAGCNSNVIVHKPLESLQATRKHPLSHRVALRHSPFSAYESQHRSAALLLQDRRSA